MSSANPGPRHRRRRVLPSRNRDWIWLGAIFVTAALLAVSGWLLIMGRV